jgi:hypothetical protein
MKEVFKRKPTLNIMKKLTLFLCIVFLFTGCEKDADSVVETQSVNYQFRAPMVPTAVDFSVNPVITPTIQVTNLPSGAQVWFDIVSLYSDEVLVSKVLMLDDGQTQTSGDVTVNDNIFSGKYTFTSGAFSGDYEVSFYVSTTGQGGDYIDNRVALSTITYKGTQRNEPPIISDISMPSSVDANTDFLITLKATDINSDVEEVFFTLTDKDGKLAGTFFLYDDGSSTIIDTNNNKTSGDITAGDGIYSRKLSFKSTAAKGNWTFVFGAIDEHGSSSNSITQKMTLK